MKRFNIVSLFPDFFSTPLSTGLLGKAIEKKIIEVNFYNPRDYTTDGYKSVDDYPYGGGSGMLLSTEPLKRTLDHVRKQDPLTFIVFLTPRGVRFSQKIAFMLKDVNSITLVCGRYEGFDERIVEEYANLEISLGDFVTMGGEVAALAVIEAVSRLVPGVIGNESSIKEESFSNGILEYPQYTRPRIFMGKKVPEVLLSGNHEAIEKWRKERALRDTLERRPDIIRKKFYIAIVHFPVKGKDGRTIGTSVVPFDIHDAGRVARTYGASGVFIITPFKTQQSLTRRLIFHWIKGYGSIYNETRKEAMELVRVSNSIEEAKTSIEQETGMKPVVVSTTAREIEGYVTYKKIREMAHSGEIGPFLYLFGTGWGLTDETLKNSDVVLEPVRGFGYNHLSVRSATSIIVDRIYGI